MEIEIQQDLQMLYGSIAVLIKQAKTKVAITANTELTMLYWNVGKAIHQFVLQGNRAAYGKQIIINLPEMLTLNFGSGWSDKHLRHCLRTAETIEEQQIIYAVRRQLSWTHIKTISYEENAIKRQFYLEMSISQRWNTRTLADQIDKMLFERTAIAQEPNEQIQQALQGLTIEEMINPDLFFKKSYVLDFLNLKRAYSEEDLENALISHIQEFIQELGGGFAFVERHLH